MAVIFMPSSRRCLLPVTLLLVICATFGLYSTSRGPGVVKVLRNMQDCASHQMSSVLNKVKVMVRSERQTGTTDGMFPDKVEKVSAELFNKFDKYKLSNKMKNQIFGCLRLVEEIADSINMTWWMTAGTLLGSYRHHGMIPWDADIDVIGEEAKGPEFRKVFYERMQNGTIKGFDISTHQPWDKVHAFPGHKSKVPPPFGTPFVDIFWYKDNGTHVIVQQHPKFSWDDILPLTKRPLNGKLYPSPRDPRNYISKMYGHDWDNVCKSGRWDYINEERKPEADRDHSVPCAALVDRYPFVSHTRGPGGSFCKEELIIGGRVMSSFTRSAKNITIC